MRNAIVVISFLAVLSGLGFAEEKQPVLEWTAVYKGMGGRMFGCPRAIYVDGKGNVYVTGTSEAKPDSWEEAKKRMDKMDPNYIERMAATLEVSKEEMLERMEKIHSGYHPAGRRNFATVKYDKNGQEVWAARYDSGEESEPVAIDGDGLGNVYVVGGTICEGRGGGMKAREAITIKYDPNGKQVWLTREGEASGTGLLVDSPDSIDVLTTKGMINYNSKGDKRKEIIIGTRRMRRGRTEIADAAGNLYATDDKFKLSKYDKNGKLLWESTDFYEIDQIDIDTSQSIYVCGVSKKNLHKLTEAKQRNSVDIIKYDKNGNAIWSQQYESPKGIDFARQICPDNSGNVYVILDVGKFFLLVKYGSDGSKLWEKQIELSDVFADNKGNIYLVGTSTVKYDRDGNEKWKINMERLRNARDVKIDIEGNIYAACAVYGKNAEFIVMKYSQKGFEQEKENQLVTKATGAELVFEEIDKNSKLTDKQKGFAKRTYKGFMKLLAREKPEEAEKFKEGVESFDLESVSMGAPDVYELWGLGKKADFSFEEKLYLMHIADTAEIWKIYTSIDLKNLSEEEKAFLKEMHDKYGPSPINLRKELLKEKGTVEPHQEDFLDLVSAPSGSDELNDIDLVFLYRISPR